MMVFLIFLVDTAALKTVPLSRALAASAHMLCLGYAETLHLLLGILVNSKTPIIGSYESSNPCPWVFFPNVIIIGPSNWAEDVDMRYSTSRLLLALAKNPGDHPCSNTHSTLLPSYLFAHSFLYKGFTAMYKHETFIKLLV
jgi:hypothetical protein